MKPVILGAVLVLSSCVHKRLTIYERAERDFERKAGMTRSAYIDDLNAKYRSSPAHKQEQAKEQAERDWRRARDARSSEDARLAGEELKKYLRRHEAEKSAEAERNQQKTALYQVQAKAEHDVRMVGERSQRPATHRSSSNSMAEAMAKNGVNPRFWAAPRQSSGTTVITGSGGVYTTHGGAAGSSTIIETAPGHYEVRQRDGTMRRVIVTP